MNVTTTVITTLLLDMVLTCAQPPLECFPPQDEPYEVCQNIKDLDDSVYIKYQRELFLMEDWEEEEAELWEERIRNAVPCEDTDECYIITEWDEQ